MNSIKLSNKGTFETSNKIDNNLKSNCNKLSLEFVKNCIDRLYSKRNVYNDIIQKESLINKLNQNIDNFFNGIYNINISKNSWQNFIFIKHYSKFIKNLNYSCNFFFNEESKFSIYKIKNIEHNFNKNYFAIFSTLLLKKFINSDRHLLIQKFFKLLITIQNFHKTTLNICKLILEIYIKIIIDLILLNENNISFLEDLIEGLCTFLKKTKYKNKNILYFIISTLLMEIEDSYKLKLKIQKSASFLKLLNYQSNNILYEKDEIIINFLSTIYKNNISTNILYKEIYKNGILNLNYYSNSLSLLSTIIKEENSNDKNNNNFLLKKGFYIRKNNPINLENIKITEKEFSIVFSFKIFNDIKKDKNENEIIIFNFSNYSNKKDTQKFFCFALCRIDDKYQIKILSSENEWIIENLFILNKTDYFICISKNFISKKEINLELYINNNVSNKLDKNQKKNSYWKLEKKFNNIDFSQMKLKIGEKNFEGIFGDFFIINKALKDKDISQLLNLKGNYSYIIENIDDKIELLENLDNFNTSKKGVIDYFQKIKYKCILKLLSENIGSNYSKGNEVYTYNYSLLINEENTIETFKLKNTKNIFLNGNGIDFLVFQMHHFFNIFEQDNIGQNELDIFNSYLYKTLKFYYDIIIIINGGTKTNIVLNGCDKFNYFFLSLLIILHYYKKYNKNLQMNQDIYNLLLEFISFCEDDYFEQRNLILSILLDNTFFAQKNVLKRGQILENIDFILVHNLCDKETGDYFDIEILYKLLNLQFILKSKEYGHKLYLKVILGFLETENEKIIKIILSYIFNIKNENILYHYLRLIFFNFKSLKNIFEEKITFNNFSSFLKRCVKNYGYKNSEYGFKITYLIYLLENELKILPNYENNFRKSEIPPNMKIKYKISDIKTKFINCFDLDNNKIFNFVKNYDSILIDKSHIKKERETVDKNQKNNLSKKSSLIPINFNLIEKINEKKFFSIFTKLINKINNLYNFVYQRNSNNKEIQEYSIKSIFEMINFFFEEIIIYQKVDNNCQKIYFNLVLIKKLEIKKFFEIYLIYDFQSAIDILENIILSTISEIESPFYFKFLNYENIIDKNDLKNNKKIIKEIFKLIFKSINKQDDFEEIINKNKEKLLLIIYLNLLKDKNNIIEFEKLILGFIMANFNLSNQKLIQFNFFYLIKGEYYYLFELLLNILFEFFDLHNYDKNYLSFVKAFIFSSSKISFFMLNDQKLINNEISENIQNVKENYDKKIYFPNILNSLYFLIYFLLMKNKNKKTTQSSDKETFINYLIEIFFNDCIQIFELINKRKLSKKFIIKANIPKLEIYNCLYNAFISKDKNYLTLENIEKDYMQKYYEILINENSKNNNTRNTFNYYNKTNFFHEANIKTEEIENNNINNNKQLEDKKEKKYNDEINNINENFNDFEQEKKYNSKSLSEKENIPLIYFNKIIKEKQDDEIIKVLSNPKAEFIWKTFTFSLKDMIFYSKDFEQLTKSFKMFSRNYTLETSSPEENELHLNYPTKIKNFICDDYYRPFLKPDIKFFNEIIIKLSHNYVSPEKFEKIRNKQYFNKINFIKYIPINFDNNEQHEIMCENISYRGSVLGKIHLKNNYLAFIDDYFYLLEKCKEKPLYFVLSLQDFLHHAVIKSKTILIFYKEIKEIIVRRIFLKRIGYEIFLKNGRSYLFNFFNLENFNRFQNEISKKDVLIINDLVKDFEKRDYKNKFKKGEISNFQYLLKINKYSTRTYNDINQYLVFPIIYMNLQNEIKRDLSKPICLNKSKENLEMRKYIDNYDIQGNHFNNHYSTSAFVLYYLVRLLPYTNLLIDFQSLKFDIPERIFSDYNTFYSGLVHSSENRELIPELFYNFEMCLNINHINVGKLFLSNVLINNFNSNIYKTCIEFIINHRLSLEKANIVPWINNVFGYNQLNESKESFNVFPLSSYEQKFEDNNIQKEKEKNKNLSDYQLYLQIRLKLAILDIGITPAQLFKSPHPEKNNNNNDINDINRTGSKNLNNSNNSDNNEININNSINNFNNTNKREKKLNKKKIKNKDLFPSITNFTKKQHCKKYKLFFNEKKMNLFYIYKDQIFIMNILSSDSPIKIKFPVLLNLSNNLVNLESEFSDNPSKNIILELMDGYYCICRNENKTLKFINFTQEYKASFLWTSIITSIELFHYEAEPKYSGLDFSWLIFFGDEEGFLGIIKSKFEYFNKNNEVKIKKIKVKKKIKIHENCINNLLYNERLNIIISSSLNGDIAINNAYSLEILNIIQVGKNFLINDIKISLYDLLYVESYNCENKNYYLTCFTLNGIKATEFNTKTKIVNFIINKDVYLFYENKIIDKFLLYDFKTYYKNEEDDNLIITGEKGKFKTRINKIIHSKYSKKLKKVINILDNNTLELENFYK